MNLCYVIAKLIMNSTMKDYEKLRVQLFKPSSSTSSDSRLNTIQYIIHVLLLALGLAV